MLVCCTDRKYNKNF